MAAGDSIVSICNIGLIAIGEDPIAALTDNNKRAILCRTRYDQVRRAVLRARNWNFARKRAILAASSTVPAFGYGAAYDLPADFIRFYSEDEQSDPYAEWVIENGQVLSNDTAPLQIRYIFDAQDCTRFDPLFVDALGQAMGAELAEPLTQSASKAQGAAARAAGAMSAAATASAQENSPKPWDVDVLLSARG